MRSVSGSHSQNRDKGCAEDWKSGCCEGGRSPHLTKHASSRGVSIAEVAITLLSLPFPQLELGIREQERSHVPRAEG